MTLNTLARKAGVPYKEMLALLRRGAIRARRKYRKYYVEDAYAQRLLPLLRVRRMLQESERKCSRQTLVSLNGAAKRAGTTRHFIAGLIRSGAIKLTRIGDRQGIEINYLKRVLPVLRSMVLIQPRLKFEDRRAKARQRLVASRKIMHHTVPRVESTNSTSIRPAA